jgi:hypothetical protein
MRLILIIISVAFLLQQKSVAQGFGANLNPEDTFCFVKIKLLQPQGTAYANAPVQLRGIKGHIIDAKTDNFGKVKVKVPFDDTYTVFCGQDSCMKTIAIDKFPFVTYNFRAYTRRFIYFTFTYKSLAGLPLVGERVTVGAMPGGQQWQDTTNAKGQCYFVLPFVPQFVVSVLYHDSVTVLRPIDVGKEYKVLSADFRWMGAKEKERRAHVADSIARIRHLSVYELLDSLVRTNNREAIAELDFTIPLDYDSTDWVVQMLQQKALVYRDEINKDSSFFESNNKAVLAPLYRLHNQYKTQIIVTDITGSMYGYMEQVLLWHALNFMGKNGKKYLFFNDGDGKSTADKQIGKTGGFYYCEGVFNDFKHILKTIRNGMDNGSGGEYPENDVEALLAAANKCSPTDELFLIADNFSPVRDLVLMRRLKIPVRIIVCGVEEGGSEFWGYDKPNEINEEYLNLARATGGSIHTVNEDIYDLAGIKEGNTLILNGTEYILQNGRFISQKKL